MVDETESESESEEDHHQQQQQGEKKAAAWAMAKKMAPAPFLFGLFGASPISSLLSRSAAPVPAGAKKKNNKKGERGSGDGKTVMGQAWSGLVTLLKWTGLVFLGLLVFAFVMSLLFPPPPFVPAPPSPPRYDTYNTYRTTCTPARPATYQHRQAAPSGYSSSYGTICTPSRRR